MIIESLFVEGLVMGGIVVRVFVNAEILRGSDFGMFWESCVIGVYW